MRSSDEALSALRPSEFVLFEIDESLTELSFSSIFSLISMGFVLIFSIYLVSFAFLRIEEIESFESNDSSERI